jgi:pimeloyl-ACP methyl ester carboxylesterase
MVQVDTHSLHIRCAGKGNPVVVIDTGVGDRSDRWLSMQNQIAEFTRACTYDRAGYGLSEPGPMPRHSQREADELKRLLVKAGIRGPYVLVGHSLGAINAQVFAQSYPDRVAGLVLLDPSPLEFITGQAFPELYQMLESESANLRKMAEAAQQSTDAEFQTKANYLEAVASEHTMLVGESADQVAEIKSFGDTPLVVVGSGKPNPAFGDSAEAYQGFWVEQNRELADRSSRGMFVLASESGHYLHEDAPDVVLDAIRQAIEAAR